MKGITLATVKLTSVAILLGLCNVAHAAPTLYAGAFTAASSDWGDDSALEFGTPNGNSVQAEARSYTLEASARATAQAGFGQAKALAYGGNHGGAGTSFAHALAGFEDSITLVNDELTGQAGEVTLRFYYHYTSAYSGVAMPDGMADGFVSFDARAGDSFARLSDAATVGSDNARRFLKEDASGSTTEFNGNTGVLTITTQFLWGEAFAIGLDVGALGTTASPDATQFSFLNNAGNSGYWDGVQSIMSNGSLVDSFRIVSESGTDYSHSFVPRGVVPEPAGYLLLLAGAAMMVSVRRLKRR